MPAAPVEKRGLSTRTIVIVVAIIGALAVLAGLGANDDAPSRPAGVPASKPRAEEQQTHQARIRSLMGSEFGDELRLVYVVSQAGEGWGVYVEFDASDSLTMGWIRSGIEGDMADAYDALFNSPYDVRQASMAAYSPTTDKYGNSSETVVYKTLLESGTARRVNWAESWAVDWPRVWTTSMMHPELRQAGD